MEEIKRLYIFTGKGGVGKTTCAFSFAMHLQQEGKKVVYSYISSGAIDNDENQDPELKNLSLELLPLELKKSTAEYISQKLKSKIVASLVVKAPFFKSLISMIPGFNYLIYLGKIIFELRNDPDLHIVFDSPSSGHALTMIKAPQNFADIFKSGVLYDDTQGIRDFLFKETQTQVNIISIPTQMSCNEAVELQKKLHEAENGIKSKVFLNNSLSLQEVNPDELPDFLREKFQNEQKIIEEFKDSWDGSVPRANATQAADIVKEIVPFMKNLV